MKYRWDVEAIQNEGDKIVVELKGVTHICKSGDYLVRDTDGQIQVWDKVEFEKKFRLQPEPLSYIPGTWGTPTYVPYYDQKITIQ